MKVLFIEDDENKISSIKSFLDSVDYIEGGVDLRHVDNLPDARRCILTQIYDLIIFDVYLPIYQGELAQNVSNDIVTEFMESQNSQAEAIAITRYSLDDVQLVNLFNDNGITIVEYADHNEKWKAALDFKLRRSAQKVSFEFLIFCALTKERSAYSETEASVGSLKKIYGMNCQELSIGKAKGLCITPSRVGLVNMAIVASKAIELFRPKIVAMSGICAGVDGEANFLDILVGDVCWEYQTGKFKNDRFEQEPYQSSVTPSIKTDIAQWIEDPSYVNKFKAGLFDTELKKSSLRIVPISSGSAVIADDKKMQEIGLHHRKMAGLEMEMYAMYEAAHQSSSSPAVFGAKAVVDMGNSLKGDLLHSSACILSARFVVDYIANFSTKIRS